MRRSILLAVGVLLVAGEIFLAANASAAADPQIENIKTLRSNLLVKMPALMDLFDNERNGVNAAANSIQKQYQDSVAGLNKKIETESAKTGDARDKAALDALTAKADHVQAIWADRQNAAPAYRQKIGALVETRTHLIAVVNDLTNIDQEWLKADCDRALMIGILTELNKRVDDVKAQVTTVIMDYIKQSTDAEHSMQE